MDKNLIVRTEDGHDKAPCTKCEGLEHVQILEEHGKCLTCVVEANKTRSNA